MGGKNTPYPGIYVAGESSIEIRLYSRKLFGEHRKEITGQLPWPPTPENLEKAQRLRERMKRALQEGTFDYQVYFDQPPYRERRALAEQARRRYQPKSTGVLLESFIEQKRAELKRSTWEDWSRAIHNILAPAFGTIPVVAFRWRDFEQWYQTYPAGKSRCASLMGLMRQAFDLALERELIEHNPFTRRKLKSRPCDHARNAEKEDVIDPFRDTEMDTIILAASEQHGVGAMIKFWLWTGLRSGEIFALRWSDIDTFTNKIRVARNKVRGHTTTPKTHKARWVSLLPGAIEALNEIAALNPQRDGEIFLHPRTDRPYTNSETFRKHVWKRAIAIAQVRYRYPYQLRHTFASWMLLQGREKMWVAQQLGHANTAMIDATYGRFIEDMERHNPNIDKAFKHDRDSKLVL
ncbi:MAG: tyrosine-type recombinase/integrase [Gammaproteobacteria bacterium]